jgi:hypothetical protein
MAQQTAKTGKTDTAASRATKPERAEKQAPAQASAASKGRQHNARKQAAAADRHSLIATAAYYRAQQRAFDGGDELSDWLAAEAEIDALFRS